MMGLPEGSKSFTIDLSTYTHYRRLDVLDAACVKSKEQLSTSICT